MSEARPAVEDDAIDAPAEIVRIDPAKDPVVMMLIDQAKQNPRSVKEFQNEAASLVTLDPKTAEACIYALPRGDKKIRGPSIRCAEILQYSWKYSMVDAGVTDVQHSFLSSSGTFMDLERLFAVRKSVRRPILYSKKHKIESMRGKRYDEDMVLTTGNAATSIAQRNAILSGIPQALWMPIYERARVTALGNAGSLSESRQTWIEWFTKAGIPEARLFELLEVKGIQDVGMDEIEILIGAHNGIQEGSLTIEDLLDEGVEEGTETPSLQARVSGMKTDTDLAKDAKERKELRDALVKEGGELVDWLQEAEELTPDVAAQAKAWLKSGVTKTPDIQAKVEEWKEKMKDLGGVVGDGDEASDGDDDDAGEKQEEVEFSWFEEALGHSPGYYEEKSGTLGKEGWETLRDAVKPLGITADKIRSQMVNLKGITNMKEAEKFPVAKLPELAAWVDEQQEADADS